MSSDKKPSILFVDDDASVLSGLRTTLRRQRNTWDLEFAQGGEQALSLMERQPFDVIVSDMRMPGMDGAQLLTEVRRRWPSTTRIVLTGEADRSQTLRAIPVTQQWLTKPCKRDELVRALEQAILATELLVPEELRGLVGGRTSLAAVPSNYGALLRLLESADSSIEQIIEPLVQDPAMTAKVLQLANSSLFGRTKEINHLRGAVSLIGLEALSLLVLAVGVFDTLREDAGVGGRALEILTAIEHESMAMSKLAARFLAEDHDLSVAAGTAGILHGLGYLAFLPGEVTRLTLLFESASDPNVDPIAVERRMLGAGHAELAASLMAAWGLPNSIVLPIAQHHDADRWAVGFAEVSAALLAAEVMVKRPWHADGLAAVLAPYGMAERLEPWKEEARAELEKS